LNNIVTHTHVRLHGSLTHKEIQYVFRISNLNNLLKTIKD